MRMLLHEQVKRTRTSIKIALHEPFLIRQGTSLVRAQPVAIDYQPPNNRSVKVIGFVRSFDNRSVKVRQNACRL